MSRSGHSTEDTSAAIDTMFAKAVAPLGLPLAEPDVEAAMRLIPLEGVAFGDRPRELRRPGSKFYATTYTEAKAVIRALAQLGLHDGVCNVVRREPNEPDVRVSYADGSSILFEHAMILDDRAMQLDVAIEDANFEFERLASNNGRLRHLLDHGVLTVRLNSIDVTAAVDTEGLAAEASGYASDIDGDIVLARPDANLYPILTSFGATVFYKACKARSAMPIRLAEPFPDRWSEAEPAFERRLLRKQAATYSRNGAQLWLILSFSNGYDHPARVEQIARRVIGRHGLGQFSKVIVQLPRGTPIVFSDVA